MKIFTYILLTFLFYSCASQKPQKTLPTYSQDTESEFESIENDRQKVLDHYRRLREKDWEKYKSRGKSKRYVPPRRKQAPKRISRPAPKPKSVKPPLDPKAVEELKIEMGQYMSYFCMSNRKRFDGADCSAFTENALNECENDYPVIRDRKIVNCLKKKLR